MRTFRFFILLIICFFIAGWAMAEAVSVDEILKEPFGSGGLSLGMTKIQVVQRYGNPDFKNVVRSSEWKEPREEWFYRARIDILPINAGYLSDDLYLYFDGDSLTNISHRSLGKIEEEGTRDVE